MIPRVGWPLSGSKKTANRTMAAFRAIVCAIFVASGTAVSASSPWSAVARSVDRLRTRDQLADGPIPCAERRFLVNGWHWHNLVVQLHLGRLADALAHEPPPSAAAVQQAWTYLWSFSACALDRTESRLFFPWMRSVLPAQHGPAVERLAALSAAEQARGARLDAHMRALGSEDKLIAPSAAARLRRECLELQGAMEAKHSHALALAVPLVAANVCAAEQERFNNRVIASMGVGASRLHLVGMADVVEVLAVRPTRMPALSLRAASRGHIGFGLDGDQRPTFRARIPWVARSMIPRWRSLYSSRAGPLLSADSR